MREGKVRQGKECGERERKGKGDEEGEGLGRRRGRGTREGSEMKNRERGKG